MAFEHYVYTGTKRLRCGYTTGSCAALAAKAATRMLLAGQRVERESITTPKGIPVGADVLDISMTPEGVACAVKKDAGDDIDVTNGLLIYAAVRHRAGQGIQVHGGKGVGRVTKPGLQQPVGKAAINDGPRQMIAKEVEGICRQYGYSGGIEVLLTVPGGEEAAKRTFNPNLGVVGGISILGTTGIVEPRSLAALRDSIELEIGQHAALGAKRLAIVPGNYGQEFAKVLPELAGWPVVSCANFIGAALDSAARHGFRQVLLVGHIGKLVKVAGGIMDTHSRIADCRVELFCAHAAMAGAGQQVARVLMGAATTEACIEILQDAGLQERVLASLGGAIGTHLERRVAGACAVGAILFSSTHGELYRTAGAEHIFKTAEAEG